MIYSHITKTHRSRRTGFTLVEMLVAVALVLLMMSMFAEIFTMATGTMSRQKGLSENDQRARLLTTLLRSDIADRTFENLIPFHPADDPVALGTAANSASIVSFDGRAGMFYVSENDIGNDVDDILHLTVTHPSSTPFFGRTRTLLDAGGTGLPGNPNQPENDDGDFSNEGAGVGSSPDAEVMYFVRNGVLYRRVLLLRQPLLPSFLETPSAGSAGTGTALITTGNYPGSYVAGGTTYPRDFDYSASYDLVGDRLRIHADSMLNNRLTTAIGLPYLRFGHRPNMLVSTSKPGHPFEFLPNGDFIGRYTHQETSSSSFGFPGVPGDGGNGWGDANDTNPYTRPAAATFQLNTDFVVTDYATGSRQGEDILLTNVHAFDIKLWDNFLGRFVDVGHAGNGYLAQGNNRNPGYGPSAGGNHCFDTWHRNYQSHNATRTYAPFRPATPGSDGAPGYLNVDEDNDDGDNDTTTGADNPEELGWPGTDDVPLAIRAIQINVRYLDVSSNLMRDVTIVESLVPTASSN